MTCALELQGWPHLLAQLFTELSPGVTLSQFHMESVVMLPTWFGWWLDDMDDPQMDTLPMVTISWKLCGRGFETPPGEGSLPWACLSFPYC